MSSQVQCCDFGQGREQGHARPFAFDLDFVPAPGIIRQQCGTQPILSMTVLDAALDVWDDGDVKDLHAKSKALCRFLITLVEDKNSRHGRTLFGSRDMENRGSYVWEPAGVPDEKSGDVEI